MTYSDNQDTGEIAVTDGEPPIMKTFHVADQRTSSMAIELFRYSEEPRGRQPSLLVAIAHELAPIEGGDEDGLLFRARHLLADAFSDVERNRSVAMQAPIASLERLRADERLQFMGLVRKTTDEPEL